MRGASGTSIRLTIFRSGREKSFDVTVTRKEILLEPVTWKLEGSTGVITVNEFSADVGNYVYNAIADLRKQGGGKLSGLVLDLRSNPGGELDEAVEKALTEVGLWNDLKDRLDDRAISLQLEQQQKLCIARLLPLKPQIILMDEPCSALDVEGTRAIEELMWSLAGRFTIVIVTHNMAQARRASHETIFMLLGELIEHSRTEDLFLTPRNPKTAEYIEGRYG